MAKVKTDDRSQYHPPKNQSGTSKGTAAPKIEMCVPRVFIFYIKPSESRITRTRTVSALALIFVTAVSILMGEICAPSARNLRLRIQKRAFAKCLVFIRARLTAFHELIHIIEIGQNFVHDVIRVVSHWI